MPLVYFAVPLLGIIFLNLLSREKAGKAAFWTGIAASSVQMAVSLTAGALLWQKSDGFVAENLGIDFITKLNVDFFSAVVLFTIGLVTFTAFLVCNAAGRKSILNFTNLLLLGMAGMSGVVMVRDLFTMYVFLEITAAVSFILISLHREKDGFEGSFKYLVLSATATIMMLLSISIFFMRAGGTSFTEISGYLSSAGGKYPADILIAFMLLISGLFIKAGAVPFHWWVPDAYSSAPPAAAVLLAGIVTKVAGVYTIIRIFNDMMNKDAAPGKIMIWTGVVSIVFGALAALDQKNFRRLLAYSSISQVGYILLGAGLGTPLGFAAALLHFFNHAVFKSLLFVNSAAVESATGINDTQKLGGLASKMPITGGTSIIGFLSAAGIPPLSGFWSKLLVIVAAWQAAEYAPAAIALLAGILTLAYFLILQRKVFFGELKEGLENIREANAGFSFAAILLSAVTVAIGLLFPLVLRYLQSAGII